MIILKLVISIIRLKLYDQRRFQVITSLELSTDFALGKPDQAHSY